MLQSLKSAKKTFLSPEQPKFGEECYLDRKASRVHYRHKVARQTLHKIPVRHPNLEGRCSHCRGGLSVIEKPLLLWLIKCSQSW